MMTIEQQADDRIRAIQGMMAGTVPLNGGRIEHACAAILAIITPTVSGGLFALPAPVVLGTAADAAARDAGYTRCVQIEGGAMGGEFLIQPDTDLDGRYRAWGVDWQEWTWVNGWNVLVEEVVG